MSSDRRFGLSRLVCAVILAASAVALSGCQVQPLYAERSNASHAMASVGFADAKDRVSQEVRNRLVFLAGKGAGEAANPEYRLDYEVKTRAIGVLVDSTTDTPRAGRIMVNVGYTLKKSSTGEILKAGNRSVTALVDYSEQEFAKIRAIRDAENRAAREVAELINLDLAGYLAR